MHCKRKFVIDISRLVNLCKHLVEAHPNKLTEDEKKDMKFYWDYFTLKSDSNATCKICNKLISYTSVQNLKEHLRNVHKIFDPSPDNEINNECSSYSDANRDISKEKYQEAPSNSSNLFNYQMHEFIEGTGALNEKTAYNLIPVRRWIRGHYTKLTKINEATCNHCNGKFIINNRSDVLHKHLVKAHPDKLTEEEKKEVKFNWTWDYFTLKGDDKATCKICKATLNSIKVNHLKNHLKSIHEILGSSLDIVRNNESSSYANSDLRKAKHQEAISNHSSNLSNRQLHECTEGTGALNEKTAYNLIPVRRWIRGHYTKLTKINEATCNHCNGKFIINNRSDVLHKHLVKTHPDKLTEEEKKEVKFNWTWDYFTLKGDDKATCEICKKSINCTSVNNLKRHLRSIHQISGFQSNSVIINESYSDSDVDANNKTTLKKAKR